MKTSRYVQLGALLLALVAFMISNSIAHAHDNCEGTDCRSLDPISEHCSGDVHTANYSTYYQSGVGTIEVQIRHSNVCSAFWTKAISYNGNKQMLGRIKEVLDPTYTYYYPLDGDSFYTASLYTDMVSGTSSDYDQSYGWMAISSFSYWPSGLYVYAYCYAFGHD